MKLSTFFIIIFICVQLAIVILCMTNALAGEDGIDHGWVMGATGWGMTVGYHIMYRLAKIGVV